jgi:hypothetical protein
MLVRGGGWRARCVERGVDPPPRSFEHRKIVLRFQHSSSPSFVTRPTTTSGFGTKDTTSRVYCADHSAPHSTDAVGRICEPIQA